jgi:WD40 repeat protein
LAAWDLTRNPDYDLPTWGKAFAGAVAFSPDSRNVTIASHEPVFLGEWAPGTLETWHLRDRTRWTLQRRPRGVWQITAFGDTLAIVEGHLRDGSARVTLRDWATRKVVGTIEEDDPFLLGLAATPDGKHLALCGTTWDFLMGREGTTAARSSQVFVYGHDRDGWKRQAVLNGFSRPVSTAFTPDSRQLITAELWGKDVSVWDWRAGRLLRRFEHAESILAVAVTADGQTLAVVLGDPFALRKPVEILVRDLKTGRVVATLRGHKAGVNAVCFSPDGARLASASSDGTARIWDWAKQKELLVLRHDKGNWVLNVAFAADGRALFSTWKPEDVTVRGQGGLTRWDAQTGKKVADLARPRPFPLSLLAPSLDWPQAVALSSDGKTLLSGDFLGGDISLWDVATGKRTAVLAPHEREKSEGHRGLILCACVSADDRLLATGGQDRTIRLWDRRTNRLIGTLRGHRGPVTHLSQGASGTLVSVGWIGETQGKKSEVICWDVRSRQKTRSLDLPPRSDFAGLVAFSRDGRLLATPGSDGESVALWDVVRGSRRRLTAAGPDAAWVTCLAVSANGDRVAAGRWEFERQRDGAVRVWYRIRLWELATEKVRTWTAFTIEETIRAPQQGTATPIRGEDFARAIMAKREGMGILSMAFSPDGKTLATGNWRGEVELWHLEAGEKVLTLPAMPEGSVVSSLDFSPDGKTLAVGSMAESQPRGVVLYHASGQP